MHIKISLVIFWLLPGKHEKLELYYKYYYNFVLLISDTFVFGNHIMFAQEPNCMSAKKKNNKKKKQKKNRCIRLKNKSKHW